MNKLPQPDPRRLAEAMNKFLVPAIQKIPRATIVVEKKAI